MCSYGVHLTAPKRVAGKKRDTTCERDVIQMYNVYQHNRLCSFTLLIPMQAYEVMIKVKRFEGV
jgi:hypothetical protein